MSWHAIADALAERLMYAEPCGSHLMAPFDPANCPFCADADAMRLYVEKGGTVRVPRVQGRSVPIQELMRAEEDTDAES